MTPDSLRLLGLASLAALTVLAATGWVLFFFEIRDGRVGDWMTRRRMKRDARLFARSGEALREVSFEIRKCRPALELSGDDEGRSW